MRPVPVKQRPSEQTKALINLDQAEMELALLDEPGPAIRPRPSTQSAISYDALCEFRSAASLVLDRDEIEALEREFHLAQRPCPVAA